MNALAVLLMRRQTCAFSADKSRGLDFLKTLRPDALPQTVLLDGRARQRPKDFYGAPSIC